MMRVIAIASVAIVTWLVAATQVPSHERLPMAAVVVGAAVTQPFGCTSLELEPFDPGCPTLHFHTDRADPKPILAKSWKPAEGKDRCAHARPAVIALGEGQGTESPRPTCGGHRGRQGRVKEAAQGGLASHFKKYSSDPGLAGLEVKARERIRNSEILK